MSEGLLKGCNLVIVMIQLKNEVENINMIPANKLTSFVAGANLCR
jgi:hypothetical protein